MKIVNVNLDDPTIVEVADAEQKELVSAAHVDHSVRTAVNENQLE